MCINLVTKYLKDYIKDEEYELIFPQVEMSHNLLHSKKGAGNDFTGWVNLPCEYDRKEFEDIKLTAEKIKKDSDVLVVIGIGGSYLGARAVIEYMKSVNYNLLNENTPKIYFVGNNMSSSYILDILKLCENKEVSINVISKSGTTTEPAIAFRIFREFMENKYGKEEAKKRIYCTTDQRKGTLKELSDANGYKTFVIPDNIGGRFSVLTAVGLLPIAVSGVNIDELMKGAAKAQLDFSNADISKNICYKYAAIRNILYRKGKLIEVFASYEPNLLMLAEWWKQLYGESEGKDGKGLFPAAVQFSTDLHSMGQYIQDGNRIMFETVLFLNREKSGITIKESKENGDGLNFLTGKTVSYVNKKAFEGTLIAHCDGGVPNILIDIKDDSESTLGYLIYFFEKACAISGYMLGVNPFNQPGVEAYKKNMFALLGKPGYEKEKEKLELRLK